MGRFIEFEIDAGGLEPDRAKQVERACPVDIFALEESGRLVTVERNEDECILCGRCVELAPAAVTVRRAYGERREVAARGEANG